MNYNLQTLTRNWACHVLLAASRALARAGARTAGHPSAQAERVVQRPALQVVRTEAIPASHADYARGWIDARAAYRDAR